MAVYGIDLGTTYSCIAKLDSNGSPVIIQDDENAKDTMASAIFYLDDGNTVVGEGAKEAGIESPERLCQFFKRYIGREDLKLEDRDEFEKYIIDGVQKDPVELSSIILKKIVEYANAGGEDVHDVVITCPAYFNFAQREATKKAGELIGLNVLGIINEPTAAAMNYSHEKYGEDDMTVLVYDLGGGTFDVTLIRMTMTDGVQNVDVLSTEGDDRLGGKDWDERVRELLIEKLCAETGYGRDDIPEDTLYEIRGRAEGAKQKLTTKASCKVKVLCDGSSVNLELTRDEFDARCADLLDKTYNLTNTTIEKAGITRDAINVVLLVGGSTSMIMVREMLKREFGEEKVIFGKPNLAVAMGAALVAQSIKDGIHKDLIEQLSKEILRGQYEVIENPNGEFEVIDRETGEKSEERTEQLKIIQEEIPANDNSDPMQNAQSATELTRGLLQKAAESENTKPKTVFSDVAPSTFGIIVGNGDGTYNAVNLLKKGTRVPFHLETDPNHEDTAFGTAVDGQQAIAIPVVMSNSENDYDACTKNDDGSYNFPNPSLGMQELNRLVVPINSYLMKGSPVSIVFDLNNLGEITLSATLCETNETNRITFSFNKGYDDAKMAEMGRSVANMKMFDEV